MAIDFRQYYYTSIAEIKGFRFKLRKDHLHPKEIITRMRYQVSGGPAPIHSALLGGANHRSDGLTLPEARL